MSELTYKELQDQAELLDIPQNQKKEVLVIKITEATTPKAVSELMAIAGGLRDKCRKLEEATPLPDDISEVIDKIDELHEVQLSDKNVFTEPYLTGMANNTLVVRALVAGESVDEDKFIKPITQVDVGGAKIPTQRERLVKAAGNYITVTSGTPQLRTNLSKEDIAKADEIMVALGGKKGVYVLPKE